jgi:hypothetical protein
MLPINDTIRVDKEKYMVESIDGETYLITHQNHQFIVYKSDNFWRTADDVDKKLLYAIGKRIEELIWFRANGI